MHSKMNQTELWSKRSTRPAKKCLMLSFIRRAMRLLNTPPFFLLKLFSIISYLEERRMKVPAPRLRHLLNGPCSDPSWRPLNCTWHMWSTFSLSNLNQIVRLLHNKGGAVGWTCSGWGFEAEAGVRRLPLRIISVSQTNLTSDRFHTNREAHHFPVLSLHTFPILHYFHLLGGKSSDACPPGPQSIVMLRTFLSDESRQMNIKDDAIKMIIRSH